MRTPPNACSARSATPPGRYVSATRERLEREPPAGPQHGVHPGERARAVLRREVAEAVAPAHDGVERARHGQRAQVAGEEPRVEARRGRGGGRVLDLGGRDVDAGHAVAGAGERRARSARRRTGRRAPPRRAAGRARAARARDRRRASPRRRRARSGRRGPGGSRRTSRRERQRCPRTTGTSWSVGTAPCGAVGGDGRSARSGARGVSAGGEEVDVRAGAAEASSATVPGAGARRPAR